MLTRTRLRELTDRHGLTPSRALGQNFVVDPNTDDPLWMTRRFLYQKLFDGLLAERQAGLFFDNSLDFALIGHLVGLCSGPVHGWPLA